MHIGAALPLTAAAFYLGVVEGAPSALPGELTGALFGVAVGLLPFGLTPLLVPFGSVPGEPGMP